MENSQNTKNNIKTVTNKQTKNPKEVLDDYKYDSDSVIINRIAKNDFTDETESADIINSIVLWKINRQVDIKHDLIQEIKELSKNLKSYKDFSNYKIGVRDRFNDLLGCKGVRAAMASTILKMFMPEALPIIDKRAYREIYREDMPDKISGDKYVDYVEKVITQYNKISGIIEFSDMDKLLYQYDKDAGNKI